MRAGAVLTVVALILALIIAGLFRLVSVLDSAELTLRRLVGEVRATGKAVKAAGDLAAAVERDAASGRAALVAAKLTHEIKVEPGAGHAFFNETKPSFVPAAAAAAYTALLGWFGRYLS